MKSRKEKSQNNRNQRFSYFTYPVLDDGNNGNNDRSGSGSPKTSRSTTLIMPKVDILMGKTECFAAATRFWRGAEAEAY
jgi:hypothetical protein